MSFVSFVSLVASLFGSGFAGLGCYGKIAPSPTAILEPSIAALVQVPTLTPSATVTFTLTPSPTPTRRPSATPSPPPPSATPTETPVSSPPRNPTDQELYRFLLDSYYQLPEDEGQGFDYFLYKGRWLRWDKDLDGDGRSEIIVAATDPEQRYVARFAILEWNGQEYTIELNYEEYGHYGADIRVAFEDVNNDGIDEIVVDTLVYSGGTGTLDGWFERKLVYCLDGRCWVSWAQQFPLPPSI